MIKNPILHLRFKLHTISLLGWCLLLLNSRFAVGKLPENSRNLPCNWSIHNEYHENSALEKVKHWLSMTIDTVPDYFDEFPNLKLDNVIISCPHFYHYGKMSDEASFFEEVTPSEGVSYIIFEKQNLSPIGFANFLEEYKDEMDEMLKRRHPELILEKIGTGGGDIMYKALKSAKLNHSFLSEIYEIPRLLMLNHGYWDLDLIWYRKRDNLNQTISRNYENHVFQIITGGELLFDFKNSNEISTFLKHSEGFPIGLGKLHEMIQKSLQIRKKGHLETTDFTTQEI